MSHVLESHAQERIFALDIGTRSVVGLIVEPQGDSFRVVDCEIIEHGERSMLDGQIHDVVAVARVIEQVKQKLESRHGPLTQVAVAAAGRSLRTRRVRLDRDIRQLSAVTPGDVAALEFSAVQEAQSLLAQELDERDATRYYCVGYSVVNYYLDDEVIGSLVDQRGNTASAEVIATFLPRVVVDSLLAALNRCGLEMQALTLEPIAAINVLIPSTMRRLNIALVDIGAGTSDIALTEEGAVTAYGMVPVAGDEITDALMNAFLLDFPMAEEVKRRLLNEDTVRFQDILGVQHELPTAEVIAAIDTEIGRLARHIAEKILELNGRPPQAVMLIGGGSLTPRLPEKVAQALGLPPARVAVRGSDAIQQYVERHPLVDGPEFVTPVGIAVAARRHPVKYITVTVNETPVRIFDLRSMQVGDALMAVGVDIRRLHGRPGLAMTVTVNGRMKIIPGGHGSAPLLTCNGEAVGLDAPLANGDVIVVVPGEDGQDAQATLADLVDELDTLDVTVNGDTVSLGPIAMVNGRRQPLEAPVADRDAVEIRLPRTVDEVLRESGLPVTEVAERPVTVSCNGQSHRFPRQTVTLLLNGQPAGLHDRIRSGDQIVYRLERLPAPRVRDVLPAEAEITSEIRVMFNGQPVILESAAVAVTVDGQPAGLDDELHDGALVHVQASPGRPPVFSDVFRVVEVPTEPPDGKRPARLQMLVNGEPASFHTEIRHGDALELYWE